MLVSNKKYHDRLTVCRSCEFYKSSTKSCGTLLIGDAVEYKGEVIELCGCVMPIKTKFPFAKCPANKWVNPDLQAIENRIKALRPPFTDAHLHEISQLKTMLRGEAMGVDCLACAQSEINELLRELQRKEQC
jgi:hypothetical protein